VCGSPRRLDFGGWGDRPRPRGDRPLASALVAVPAPVDSLWRPSPRRLVQLLVGLVLFGAGEAFIVQAALGNSPWTVLAQGVAKQTPLGIGAATVAISVVVLAVWIPLRRRPGLGTVLNALLVGVALGVVLVLLPDHLGPVARAAFLLGGIGLVAAGSGLYLTTRLGPGPRDGLMTGLHGITGRSLRLIRTLIEGGALVGGFALGGRVGLGTLAFAALIGPGVQAAVHFVDGTDTRTL
jgi:uncharacterized protein